MYHGAGCGVGFVPMVRTDLVVVPGQRDDEVMATIQTNRENETGGRGR
jgi:hypothetical protein